MDQDLSQWLLNHEAEIKQRWWLNAHKMGQASNESFSLQSQADAYDLGPFRSRLLTCLASDEPPDPKWIDTLTRELSQHDWLALLSALRRALFDLLIQESEPQNITERWRVLELRLDKTTMALARSYDRWLDRIDAQRDHWQTLYNLTRELTASIDLSYVLQNAVALVIRGAQV